MTYFFKRQLSTSIVLFFFAAGAAFAQDPEPTSGGLYETAPVIREISVDISEIFDESNLSLFYRAVNKLKISTRRDVVLQELLFEQGQPFDEFLLKESERNLRSLRFLRHVSITPIFDGEFVDIVVMVQDTWTLFPFLSLSSGGGTDKQAIGITESNLLGYGKRVEVFYAEDEGREKIEGVYDDRRLFGSDQRLTLGHFQRTDGDRSVVHWGQPFRSLVEPYAWSINADIFDLVEKLFEASDERFIFRQKHTAVSGGFTFSQGDPETRLRRYSIGYEHLEDDFSEADDQDFRDVDVDPASVSRDPALLADNRRFTGPFVAYQQIEPDYLSVNYVDRFERIEDFNLGNEFSLRFQFAGKVFGSRSDKLITQFNDSNGWRISPTSFVRAELGGSFRADQTVINNAVIQGRAKMYNILGAKYLGSVFIGKHTLASSIEFTIGEKLDRDMELLLGAGNGLRGYKDRTFTGDQRLILNLEDRFHLVEDAFKLVSIGGAFFIDAGGTSSNGLGDILKDRLYANFGFGLRFGLTRSTGGSVVRLDVAFPVRDGPDGSQAFEPRILFSSGQAFSAGLRSEALNSQSATVSGGFKP